MAIKTITLTFKNVFWLVGMILFLMLKPVLSYGDNNQNIDPRCKGSSNIMFPKQDQPTITDKKLLSGCSSENFYYGIGVPVDFVKARKCAFIEREQESDLIFAGSSTLMMIYANGNGVKRNLNLAIKLACNINDGENPQYRIDHLTRLKTKTKKEFFNYCDDVQYVDMMTRCTIENYNISDAETKDKLNLLAAKWSTEDQQSFEIMQKAAWNFFDVQSSNETDQGGDSSWSTNNKLDQQESLGAAFLQSLQRLEKQQLPNYTANQSKSFDRQLNREYRKIMHDPNYQPSQDTPRGMPTRDGLKKTQKAWLLYRDAWIKFGLLHYPQVSSDSLSAWLTRERLAQLEEVY